MIATFMTLKLNGYVIILEFKQQANGKKNMDLIGKMVRRRHLEKENQGMKNGRRSMKLNKQYSFCESVNATPHSKWHIRELTKIGRKLGGWR